MSPLGNSTRFCPTFLHELSRRVSNAVLMREEQHLIALPEVCQQFKCCPGARTIKVDQNVIGDKRQQLGQTRHSFRGSQVGTRETAGSRVPSLDTAAQLRLAVGALALTTGAPLSSTSVSIPTNSRSVIAANRTLARDERVLLLGADRRHRLGDQIGVASESSR